MLEGKAATEHYDSEPMRVHNMLELGAGQCTPSPKPASQRRDLQQGEASASFGKKFSRTELFSEKSTCGAKIKLQGATVSVLLICFSQLGERELITVSFNFSSR